MGWVGLRSVVILMAVLFAVLTPKAAAHPGHDHGNDGRIPGQPDFKQIGKVEVRFHPEKRSYSYTRPNEPPLWFHRDEFPAEPGGGYLLPSDEEPVVCATSGHRIKILYGAPTSRATPTEEEVEAIRSFVRRMNWKILSESLRSSGNTRALRMRVDCDANGQIKVWPFIVAVGNPSQVFARAEEVYGYPSGAESVKNLIFYNGSDSSEDPAAGYGQMANDSIKSSSDSANGSRSRTSSAVVYRPLEGIHTQWGYWTLHVALHELFHSMGAVNSNAPYGTEGNHCEDGIDVMCYDDKSQPWFDPVKYSETRCPASSGFATPVGVPLDCMYDSYFDAAEESGEWLNTHWNTGGYENPFLVEAPSPAPPSVATKVVTHSSNTNATLRGTVTPNGLSSQYRFEYGLTEGYGSKVPVPDAAFSSNLYAPHDVAHTVSGLQPGTTYHYRLVATNAKGTTNGPDQTFTAPAWKILSAPNPEGATDSNLYDVSCEPSTNVCTSVGKSTVSGADSPIAQRWNGTSWSAQSPDKKSSTLPTRLFGVDCPSETRCLAAGNYQPTEGGPVLLTEIWNEGNWNVQSTPVPSGATSSELVAIGCSWTSECTAVGSAVIGGVKKAIAESWDSPTWAIDSIPIPEGATSSQLDGVDCIWSSVCVAVGRYTAGGSTKSLAVLWNGTSWSLQTLTAPEGAVQTTLLDVSCTKSPTRCTAVGGWKNSAGEQFTLAYRFNGSTWALQSTPNPSGSIASVFQDVSCATETSCTAVGSWVGGNGEPNRTLAVDWGGSTWSIRSTLDPLGATFSAFFGISCRNTTCMSVGWSTSSSGVDTALVETSDLSDPPAVATKPASDVGTSGATLNGTVNPKGIETTYQFEYGTTTGYGSKAPASPKTVGSGTGSVEVSEGIEGLAPETTYHFRLVASNAKGTTNGLDQTFTTPSWEILSTPNPSGASDSNLYDVSCEPSTSACTAVGSSTVSGADIPVAQRWNGTSWSEQSAAKKSGTLPTRLLGVDCPSEIRCLAVGNYQPSEGGPALLSEIWNEGKWNVQTTPVPSEAISSELVAIGCNSTAQCRAAGSAVIGGVKTAIIEAWTSPTWALQSVPIPENATSSQLDGIDCIWSSVCVAVGRYTAGGSTKSLAMLWNGTTWSLQTLTAPEGAVLTALSDVSCTPSPTRCTAVGNWLKAGFEQFTLAYRFNGSTWTLQSTPNPSGSVLSSFQEVSCATETSCTAVGSSIGGGATKTLAEKWDGTSWSIQATPNPSSSSVFLGVSCRSATCIGVGRSTDGLGVETTLAELRE
jgi:hypothetical protein